MGFVSKSQPLSAGLLLIKYCIKSHALILKGKMRLNTFFNLYMTVCVIKKNCVGNKAVINTTQNIVSDVAGRKICLGVRRKNTENTKLSCK